MDHPLTKVLLNEVLSPVFLVINPQATTILAIVILFLLIISFVLAGSEVAFFSLTYKDINILKTKQDASWKRIVTLLEEPKDLLASLLIANSIINIAIIILANFLIDEMVLLKQSFWLFEFLIKVILVAFVVILFGEVMPKVWATQNNLQFAYYTSGVVELIHLLFRRVSGWAVHRSEGLERFFGRKKTAFNLEKLASEEEKSILQGFIEFGSITVKQIMRTRLEVHGIDFQLNFAGLKQRVEELHYSRLPVYRKSLDDLAGMIHTKDLITHLNEPDDFDWHKLIRPPFFVHEHKLIEDLLHEFQQKRIHFAIVVDEFGGTSGIVTLEDIMEEVIGDIRDEFDEEESGNRRLDDGSYIFEGRTMLNDVCKAMLLPVDTFDEVKGDSDSLAGLILEISGKIPKVNDMIPCGDFEFTILDADSSRIKKVKVTVKMNA
ncbi:gliding motility-associated protein GldE [Flavitalea sp. BT771]|uniref:gliding motility-associated protein GldE n=1 Tax=Flavitalea sp. BT771 TaxID=3063329 RepID=UPI0026E1AA12|nr:gliding motility-associated protein GldE [Flavitalea sp. BT771]MDO6433770.1 gliding motility-associated protein GldE [Flavitalea sp. BT771]MDV6222325.1 gliding motility-associated protein GldE [Flavitalea sp. BT771]